MAIYKEKFLVINHKHLKLISNTSKMGKNIVDQILTSIQDYHAFAKSLKIDVKPNNRYYVCNQDEPYAKEVIDFILNGEDKK